MPGFDIQKSPFWFEPRLIALWDYREHPHEVPIEDKCDPPYACLVINQRWASHIAGAIERLLYEDAWSGTDEEIERAYQTILYIQAELGGDMGCCCDNEVTNTRINADGTFEVSHDGGQTWESSPQDDPRETSVEVPPNYPPAQELKCIAAANVVEVFKIFIQENVDQLNAGAGITAIVAALVALILLFLSAGTLTPILIGLASAVISFGATAIEAAFTSLVWTDIRCIVYCETPADGHYTEASLMAIKANITSDYPGIVADLLNRCIDALWTTGMTNAGRAGIVTADDCSSCECEAEWCYEFDFTASNHGFTPYNVFASHATYVAGQGWTSGSNELIDDSVILVSPTFAGVVITFVEIEISQLMNGNANSWYYKPNVNNSVTLFAQADTLTESTEPSPVSTTRFVAGMEAWSSPPTSQPKYTGYITRITLHGKGTNPFGADNCTV